MGKRAEENCRHHDGKSGDGQVLCISRSNCDA